MENELDMTGLSGLTGHWKEFADSVDGFKVGLGSLKLPPDVAVAVDVAAPLAEDAPRMKCDTLTVIGLFFDEEDKVHLVNTAQFCSLLDNRKTKNMDEDYFDDSVRTDLVKFNYDPITGVKVDWAWVENSL